MFCDCGYALDRIRRVTKSYQDPDSPVVEKITKLVDVFEYRQTPVKFFAIRKDEQREGNVRVDDLAVSAGKLSQQGFSRKGWCTGMGPTFETFDVECP